MPIENATYVNDLVPTNPLGTDGADTLDQHDRLVKLAVKQSFPGFTGAIVVGGTTSGLVNAYTLSPTTALPSYVENMMVVCEFHLANTGAATINISSLGAKTIKTVSGENVTSADLLGSRYTALVYDGTNFQLLAVTKNYVDQLVFEPVLPAQFGNADKMLTTDATNASWTALLKAATIRFADSTDTTKRLAFNVSGVSTGTTRTAIVPDRNINLAGDLDVRAITTTGTVGIADIGKLIDCTSGTFTLTFAAVATLGDEAMGFVQNTGTGDVTLDGNGAETIDGLADYIMYSGEVRMWYVEGASIKTIVLNSFYKTFTSSGTFTKPPGYRQYSGLTHGGGGSGGKSGTTSFYGSGGGGGGCTPFSFLSSDCSATASVVIGAGGTSVSSVGAGNAGGTTTLTLTSRTISAYGGGGGGGNGSANWSGGGGGGIFGVGGTSAGTGSNGGGSPNDTAFGGGLSFSGGASAVASVYGGGGGGNQSIAGAMSYFGGGGGGTGGGSFGSSGGISILAGAGGAGSATSNGVAGTAPSGGGGGTATGTNSGAGARGELRIWGQV